jgi:hypothetical protein
MLVNLIEHKSIADKKEKGLNEIKGSFDATKMQFVY